MKTIITIATVIVITVKGLCVCFDNAHDSVQQQAEQRLAKIEQVAK